MSKKIDVLTENRQVKKNAALAMVRARGYEWAVYMRSIRPLPIREFRTDLPSYMQEPMWKPAEYEHHIEPRLEKLDPSNSEWWAYLYGWQGVTG